VLAIGFGEAMLDRPDRCENHGGREKIFPSAAHVQLTPPLGKPLMKRAIGLASTDHSTTPTANKR
jgi:hypothetical protein